MKEKKITKDLLVISILSVVVVALWIAIDIFYALSRSKISPEVKRQTEPLNPKIDTEVLDDLEQKIFYEF